MPYCIYRSTNSVSLSLRSSSPATDSKNELLPKQQQQNPVSGSQASSLISAVANNEGTVNSASSDNKPTKRKSLSDVVTLQANLTNTSIKHDLRQVHFVNIIYLIWII